MSAFGSPRFSLILVASCFITRNAEGPATPEQTKNQCSEVAVFDFADSLFVLISLDALVKFCCIFYGLRETLCMRVENLYIEESAIKRAP